MCGIIGHIDWGETKSELPDLTSISHRGPDGYGEWKNKSKTVYFGHTRLAILDPSPTGRQPMQDASERFTITFNGEIYNHLILRKSLPDVDWRGNSDTETLLELFARERLECLEKLKGMFAFAIYDALDDTVFLVRDRLGIKPLWLKSGEGHYSFSSEIRSLIDPNDFAPNRRFMSEYIGFGRVAGTGEIMDGIRELAPGTYLTVTCDGLIEKTSWWPKKPSDKKRITNKREAVENVQRNVTEAIKEHLISDVGVGAFLSGGIDSSIVALVAGRELGKNLQTFTVGFPQASFDERSIARKVAKLSGAEHTEIEVGEEDCLEWVQQAVQKLDLPSVDAINTYIVSKAVRDTGVKVALSGLGGDELFAGYPSFRQVPLLRWMDLLPTSINKIIMNLAPFRMREKFAGLHKYDLGTLTRNRRRFTSTATLMELGFNVKDEGLPITPWLLDASARISWAEIQSYMIPMLLRDSDQMSMAVGLEIRVPFLDHRLVEETLALPQRFKKGKGIKPLLVDSFKDLLPTSVYDRPKQGFELPMDEWIRGPLSSFTDTGVETVSDRLGTLLPKELKKQFDTGEIHWTRVWHWCVLGHWLQNKSVIETLPHEVH